MGGRREAQRSSDAGGELQQRREERETRRRDGADAPSLSGVADQRGEREKPRPFVATLNAGTRNARGVDGSSRAGHFFPPVTAQKSVCV